MAKPSRSTSAPRPSAAGGESPQAGPPQVEHRSVHSVGDAAQAGGESATTESSDWLAERVLPSSTAPAEGNEKQGVPLPRSKRSSRNTAQARESRRGSY